VANPDAVAPPDPEPVLRGLLAGRRFDDPYPAADLTFLARFAPDEDSADD